MLHYEDHATACMLQGVIAQHVAQQPVSPPVLPRVNNTWDDDTAIDEIDDAELQQLLENATFAELVDEEEWYGDVTQEMVDEACVALGLLL